jgi:adenosylhomocysteine nucleosidase
VHCNGRWIGSAPTDMSKPVAIVAAMRSELAPLLRGAKQRKLEGVELYDLPSALVAIGGIGRSAGTRAAELVVREATPGLLVSAGLAGALTASLRSGDVVRAREVIDEATGERYQTMGGEAVLVTALRVAGISDKQRLAASYSASVVDMEGATVARIARQRGIRFAALKAISDELEFPMPPVNGFVTPQGQFRAVAFAGYVAVRPKWWLPTVRLALNSRRASANLSAALEHLIQQHATISLNNQEYRL